MADNQKNNALESTSSVCIRSHPENLIQIRDLLRNVLKKTTLSKEDAHMIVLAVDEACSNIIRHGYLLDYSKTIDVKFCLNPKELTISIIDDGIEFDVNSVKKRDLSDIRPGGLGIHIIHEIMDNVNYTKTADGRNKLELEKKLLS